MHAISPSCFPSAPGPPCPFTGHTGMFTKRALRCNPISAPLALAPCNLANLPSHWNPEVPGTLLGIHEASQCCPLSSVPTLPLQLPTSGPSSASWSHFLLYSNFTNLYGFFSWFLFLLSPFSISPKKWENFTMIRDLKSYLVQLPFTLWFPQHTAPPQIALSNAHMSGSTPSPS